MLAASCGSTPITFTPGVQVLDVYRDAGEQPAAADRQRRSHPDCRRSGAGSPPRWFPAGDDVGIVEGVHEHQLALTRQPQRLLERAVVVIAVYQHLGAQIDHRLHLDVRGGLRHDDHRRNAAPPGGERDPLRVIAGRGAHHAAPRTSLPTGWRCGCYAPRSLNENTGCRSSRLSRHLVAEPARDRRAASSSGDSMATS